jgi:hypothetical protein
MQFITKWTPKLITWPPPGLDLSQLPAQLTRHLWLSPQEFLEAINALALAQWAITASRWWLPPALPGPCRGPKIVYHDASILVLAFVQTAWHMPYSITLTYLSNHPKLALAMGFPGDPQGCPRVISQGQYWERRQALGLLPLLFFMIGLVWQLVRLGVITGIGLILDTTLLRAWHHADPGAAWVRYRDQPAVFGYKVHALLCRDALLPILCLVTPANICDAALAIPLLLASVLLFGFQVGVVYADAAYFEYAILSFIVQVLGASAAIDYNLRRRGKHFLATLFFLSQWRRYVAGPRRGIERHFAWAKRYFGLKYFQCWTFLRVSQYILLTYGVILGVALAAQRYGRPELRHCRAEVLARSLP